MNKEEAPTAEEIVAKIIRDKRFAYRLEKYQHEGLYSPFEMKQCIDFALSLLSQEPKEPYGFVSLDETAFFKNTMVPGVYKGDYTNVISVYRHPQKQQEPKEQLTFQRPEWQDLRQIIQEEYDKKYIDSNYNFLNRFAKAIHEKYFASPVPVKKPVSEITDEHLIELTKLKNYLPVYQTAENGRWILNGYINGDEIALGHINTYKFLSQYYTLNS